MNTKEVKTIINLGNLKLVAYADIAFDSAQGLSVECWEVFTYAGPNWKRDQLVPYDLTNLQYENFVYASEQIKEMIDNALINETIYAELEQEHIERYDEYRGEDR